MSKSRILAVVMSVLMLISMLPATVFAAETASKLDGELKIKGEAIQDSTLSADYKKVKPEGLSDDAVSFLWERKVSDSGDGSLVELSKEKTYKVTSEDVGYKIVLTITGIEDKGFTGSLKATSDTIKAAAQPAEAQEPASEEVQEQIPEETQEVIPEEQPAENQVIDETPVEEQNWEELPSEEQTQENISEEYESEEVLPGANVQEEVYYGDLSEEYEEELTPIEEPETEDAAGEEIMELNESTVDETLQDDFVSYNAQAVTEDESGVIDFGTVEAGTEDDVAAQYVTIKNTGTGSLNFAELAPEHFMVEDITEPLEAGTEITLWIIPREGLKEGTYSDTITYTSDEGATASFDAKVTIQAAETPAAEDPATTEEPGTTEDPENPGVTVEPENPEEPGVTVEPENPEEPGVTVEPENPEEPGVTVEPENPEEPGVTVEPENPEEPGVTGKPEEPAVISVGVIPETLAFDKITEGYETAPEAQTVTIVNHGTAEVALVQPASDYYDIGTLSAEVLEVGGEVTFTVQPKLGLAAGSYSDVISVYNAADETELASVEVSFEVEVKEVHKLTVIPETVDFGTVESGYAEAPKAQKITISNDGNVTENIGQPDAKSFIAGALSSVELKPGEVCTFTLQPKTGLETGEYLEEIQIPSDSGVEAVVTAAFTVQKKADTSAKLTAIQKPSEITGLANGTEKKAETLKLPATVVIETTKGNLKANVAWDVKGCSYDPSSTSAQTFNVKGTVTLPEGVKNPNDISLVTSVKVSVNGYTAVVVSPDNNQITGITPNGQYTTKSTISFTAVGAGMDNNSPRKGDIRYLPLNWTVVNTNTWTSAPYAASFGMGRSGNYTLSVVFNRQQYDGSNWVNTGEQDTKKVSFSVVQAAEQTVTPTPTANQRRAVQTGDDTPIVPLIIVLIVAICCIAGVVVYRRKKK